MTPKEKALEIFNNCDGYFNLRDEVFNCAYIVVDQLKIEQNEKIKFWDKVEQELKLLKEFLND